jgi:hypothetical protein
LWDCVKAHGPEITSVARFAVVEDGGASLRLLDATATGGVCPRRIAFDPSGTVLFAANHNSGTVTAFHVDQDSGALTPRAPRCPRSRRCAAGCLSGRRRAGRWGVGYWRPADHRRPIRGTPSPGPRRAGAGRIRPAPTRVSLTADW